MNISKGWTIFVISPFGGYFDAVFEYGLKPWFHSHETEVIVERADTYLQLTEDLIEKIQTRIKNADLIVADTTDGRPNVMYEIGFADAIGKRIIYLCQNTKEIPFDIRGRPHIQYNNIEDLKLKLTEKYSDLFKGNIPVHLKEFWKEIILSGATIIKPVQPRKIAEDRYSWVLAEYDEMANDQIWRYLVSLLPRSIVAGGRLMSTTTRYPVNPSDKDIENTIKPKINAGENYILIGGPLSNAVAEVTLGRFLNLKPFTQRNKTERKLLTFSDWRRPNAKSCVYDSIFEEESLNGIQICGTQDHVKYGDDFDACSAIVRIPNGDQASITLLLGLNGFGTYTAGACITGNVNYSDDLVSVEKFIEFNHQYQRAVSGDLKCAIMLISSRGVGFEFEKLPVITSVYGFR